MVAISAGTAAKSAVAAGAGTAQAVCMAKGVGMSVVLGAGAWGLVIFGVIATAAAYDYIVRDGRLDKTAPGARRKTPPAPQQTEAKEAFSDW